MSDFSYKNHIKFSVVLPVLNGERYLEESIFSVVHQTYEMWELFIIDDGSKDNSYSIGLKWEAKDSRIKILQHPNGINKGVSASRNLGIKNANGKWISLLDSDDLWDKHKLEKEEKVISDNDDIVLIYSKAIIEFSEEASRFGNTIYGTGLNGKIKDPFNNLIDGFHTPTSGLTIKKEAVDKIGGFDESLHFAEDTLLIHQILEFGNIYCLNEVLSVFRFHTDSSASLTPDKDKIAARFSVYTLLLDKVKLKNRKIVSGALVKVGFKRILRSYIIFPNNDIKLVWFYLVDLLRNQKVKTIDKFAALIMFFIEFFLLPFKYLRFRR